MIGIILLGHGNFADGLASSLKLIAGETENFEVVNFDGNSTEKLSEDIDVALEKLTDCDKVLFLSDITGGSPFQTAAMKSAGNENYHVVGGTNLGMLIEACLTRTFAEDFDAFVDTLVETAKTAIAKFEIVEKEEVNTEDGI